MSSQLENIPITHTCSICLEELSIPSPNMCITECGHVFHLKCLIQNREFNIACPMCRSKIPLGEQLFQEQEEDLNVLPDGMLEENGHAQQNIEFNDAQLNEVLEEIAIGSQLDYDIRNIVHLAANNNISNFDMDPHETMNIIHEQIYQLCISFVNSTINYLRNIAIHRYNISHLNFNEADMYYHMFWFNLHDRITRLVDNAANNNILDNRTFDTMEHNIRNLCLEFSKSVIINEQNRDD